MYYVKDTNSSGSNYYVGLDLSLTGTGVTILKDSTHVCSTTIRSRPPKVATPEAEIERLNIIIESVVEYLKKGLGEAPRLVVIEGLAFSARNTTAVMQLAGLSYMTRSRLLKEEWPFLVVAPTTLKKYITGKGNSPKELMLLEVYRRYGIAFLDNNQCDSFGLALIGNEMFSSEKQNIPEKQMVKTLSTQLA